MAFFTEFNSYKKWIEIKSAITISKLNYNEP
jgi:hypothetical protein